MLNFKYLMSHINVKILYYYKQVLVCPHSSTPELFIKGSIPLYKQCSKMSDG